MKLKRYYYNGNLSKGQTVVLDGEEFHHMANVMRTKVGDQIELFCGDANNYIGTVLSIEKKHAEKFMTAYDTLKTEYPENKNLQTFEDKYKELMNIVDEEEEESEEGEEDEESEETDGTDEGSED